MEFKVLDKGYIKLLEHMGSDRAIAESARVSTDSTGKDNRKLIRRLMRDEHTSPFEMGEIKVCIKAPISVFRQMFRHRTANLNEQSLRYTESECEFYLPTVERMQSQSKDNRQGSGEMLTEERALLCMANIADSHVASRLTYENLLELGLTRELARHVLGVDLYSKADWKIDLHNLFRFLKLRTNPHAQWEIREYAISLENIVTTLFPLSYEAWVDYVKEAVTFSKQEMEVIKKYYVEYNSIAADKEKLMLDYGFTETEFKAFMGKL